MKTCDFCNNRIYPSEGYELLNDEIICDNCLSDFQVFKDFTLQMELDKLPFFKVKNIPANEYYQAFFDFDITDFKELKKIGYQKFSYIIEKINNLSTALEDLSIEIDGNKAFLKQINDLIN